jgi:hypothetical protein
VEPIKLEQFYVAIVEVLQLAPKQGTAVNPEDEELYRTLAKLQDEGRENEVA